MKTTIITMALLLFSIVGQSQNKNVKDETKTTVTTVKTSDGEKKYVKNEVLEMRKWALAYYFTLIR